MGFACEFMKDKAVWLSERAKRKAQAELGVEIFSGIHGKRATQAEQSEFKGGSSPLTVAYLGVGLQRLELLDLGARLVLHVR